MPPDCEKTDSRIRIVFDQKIYVALRRQLITRGGSKHRQALNGCLAQYSRTAFSGRSIVTASLTVIALQFLNLALHVFENAPQFSDELWHADLNRIPNYLKVNGGKIVYETVSHSNNLCPWNMIIGAHKTARQMIR